ncbi:hypothetical protein SUDANB1_05686 [Streptomyces sp. enrichment culture]|uniref:glycine-rich domain-containing protein n=1 Tax=Streptomyces sp. enrichment culture TaxID=1795815 RepID=UPI003F54BFE0
MARACADGEYFEINDNGELTMVPGSMGLRRQIVYSDPGTYTFSKAAYPWLARVEVEVQGGGGGSAGGNADAGEAIVRPGGTGGGYSRSLIEASALGASTTVKVGAGGTAGDASNEGGDGGQSSFGSLVVAPGGFGGTANMPSSTTTDTSQGIAGPSAGTGDITMGGGASGSAIRLNATNGVSGFGGSSFMGTGGLGRSTQGNGLGPRGRGAGAGGALSFGGSVNGAPGGDGMVIVKLYA